MREFASSLPWALTEELIEKPVRTSKASPSTTGAAKLHSLVFPFFLLFT
jgi:hypothetical protein